MCPLPRSENQSALHRVGCGGCGGRRASDDLFAVVVEQSDGVDGADTRGVLRVELLFGRDVANEEVRFALLAIDDDARADAFIESCAARNPGSVGAVVGLSGGLIGPEGRSFDYEGRFDGTPVFLGCSDRDPHIPLGRVEETATVLAAMGAEVEKRIYEGMGHTVIEDELDWFRTELREIASGG